MRKSTRTISLVLIGTGLILSACQGCNSQSQSDTSRDTSRAPGRYQGGGHGVYYGGSRGIPVGGAEGRGEGAAVSRGGFRGAGHAAGGS